MFVDASTYVFVATAYVRILEFIKSKELDEGFLQGGKQNHCIAVTLITVKSRVAQKRQRLLAILS